MTIDLSPGTLMLLIVTGAAMGTCIGMVIVGLVWAFVLKGWYHD